MVPQGHYSSTVEDYLKVIYTLSRENLETDGLASLGRVAEKLNVTPGTVTTMMRHLEERGLVQYQPRKGVRLETKGEGEAVRVVRRHRMVELFLVNIMELDWADVHDEAEALEHVISDRLINRMDEMLGYPSHDPHGDPIPTPGGKIVDKQSYPLLHCQPGKQRIVRILNDESSFLNWLQERGLQPGEMIKVCGKDEMAGTLFLETRNTQLTIGISAAQAVLVARD